MEADRIRKAAKRNPEGCLTFRVLPAQRVGIPKPIEASGDQHPTGRWKRPLGTADQGSEGHTFGAGPESEFLGLRPRASTPVA